LSAVIRPAETADLDDCVRFGIGFVAKMPGPRRGPDWSSCKAYLERFIQADSGALLVAERTGQVTGFICGIIAPDPFTGKSVALKSSWIVDPEKPGDGLALLKRFEAWVTANGAERLIMSHTHGDEGVARILIRRGYAPVEVKYERLI